MSLFDDYPPQPQRNRSEPCCGFTHQDDEDRLVMHFLHELGHSRVPFGVGALADLAGIERHEAAAAIDEAVELGWVADVPLEEYMNRPTDLLVGCLTRKR